MNPVTTVLIVAFLGIVFPAVAEHEDPENGPWMWRGLYGVFLLGLSVQEVSVSGWASPYTWLGFVMTAWYGCRAWWFWRRRGGRWKLGEWAGYKAKALRDKLLGKLRRLSRPLKAPLPQPA